MHVLATLICFLFIAFSFGQKPQDSLIYEFSITQNKHNKAETALLIARQMVRENSDSALLFIDTAFYYAKDSALIVDAFRAKASVYKHLKNHEKFICSLDSALLYTQKDSLKAVVYESKGYYYKYIGDFNNSKINFDRILQLKNVNFLQIGTAHQSLSTLEKERANYIKAIDLQFKAHEIFLSLNDSLSIAGSFNQIAILYKVQEDFENALKYYRCAVNINSNLSNRLNKKYLSYNYNNIGNIYSKLKAYDSSIYYHQESLKIKRQINDLDQLGSSYLNLGEVLTFKGDYEKAFNSITQAISYSKKYDNIFTLNYSYLYMGKLFYFQNKYSKAKFYLNKSMDLSKKTSAIDAIMEGADMLYEIYVLEKNFEKALKMRNLNIQMKDSVLDIENTRAIIKNQYKLMAKSDSAANALDAKLKQEKIIFLKATDKQNKARIHTNQIMLISLSIGILLFIILVVFIYTRLRLIKNQHAIITKQKETVDTAFIQLEEKSKEIQDSIEYAKRIQTGILPSIELIRSIFKEAFVFYQPKSVVAGDFFWVKKVNQYVLFAVGDCTGHGVPGAMVSVLCQSVLNRVVAEYKIVNPAEILNQTRKLVIEHLDYGNEMIHDGMDIALCVLNTKTNELSYSGAYNPLWIKRKDELIEIKGINQPVGYYQKAKPFATKTIGILPDDMLYIFTDGYADQFGGSKNKKFKKSNFKKLILRLDGADFKAQEQVFKETFNSWKSDNEQVDDVCILGVKF